jgi:hypothetical protein
MQFPPVSCYFLFLLYKYPHQYPVLEYPHLLILFLTRGTKVHIHAKKGEKFCFVYLSIHAFRQIGIGRNLETNSSNHSIISIWSYEYFCRAGNFDLLVSSQIFKKREDRSL